MKNHCMTVTERSEQMSLYPSQGTCDKTNSATYLALRTKEFIGLLTGARVIGCSHSLDDLRAASSLKSAPLNGGDNL